jgi:hypothetical protein
LSSRCCCWPGSIINHNRCIYPNMNYIWYIWWHSEVLKYSKWGCQTCFLWNNWTFWTKKDLPITSGKYRIGNPNMNYYSICVCVCVCVFVWYDIIYYDGVWIYYRMYDHIIYYGVYQMTHPRMYNCWFCNVVCKLYIII